MGEPVRTRKEKLAGGGKHDAWVVWCKSNKELEEIRSLELSRKAIFLNCDETKSKEEKNKKNGCKKKAHRG